MRRTQQQLNERPRGIIPEYFRNTSRAQERPGVSRGSFPDWAVALQLCSTGLQHRAALLCLNGTTLRAMPCSWPAWRVEGGGLPSQACPSSEMSNEIAVHIALFTILVQYMLVKHMDFAQQFSESLVIAVVF